MPDLPKIAACLIVKDSADIITAAIESIRPHVDEINVYDTGSEDETVFMLDALNAVPNPMVCVACGQEECDHNADKHEVPLAPIRVERGEWRDDFSWAREQSFAMCSDDITHTLWLDDDDLIVGAQNLRHLAASMPPELDGLVMLYDYARDEYGTTVCQLWRERLVRRNIGYFWLNAVHEVHVPPDRPARLMMVPANQVRYIHNRPPDRYPATRNLEILLKERDEALAKGEPPTPRTLAYIGTELMAHGRFAEAVEPLEQYIRSDANWSDERMQVHHKLAGCLRILGNPMAAVHVEMEALKERDDWAETAIGLAQSFATIERWDRAERWAKVAIDQGVPQTPLIVNPLEFTLLPWMVMAEARAKLGNAEGAHEAIQKALEIEPQNQAVQAKTREIAGLLQQNEIVGAVLLLRETLVRHDENLKAYNLLENLPYVIAEHPEIVKAKADQREMVAHYLRPEEYERWYREEPKESTVDDDLVPEIGDHIPRAKRLLEGLREQEAQLGRKPRVLDLGSNDMWVACYLWLEGGYTVDGIELNKQSVAKGRKRMRHFKAPGKLHHGSLFDAERILAQGNGHAPHLYDAISLFEVIEHVPDVDGVLDLMERLLAPGGVIYVSTPNGAYERGQIGEWHRVERKGHLRAITAHELTENFQRRGDVTAFELQHGDRLTYASYRPTSKRGKVVFYAGGSWEPWSPGSINTTGLGGSETALSQVAIRMAQDGYQVKVYSGAEPGLYGGALFRPNTSWDPTEECDLLVVSRVAHVFDNPIGARKTALWCHDHSYPGQLEQDRTDKIDHIVVLSEWQRERFARLYPWAQDRLTLIRNGITLRGVPDGDDRYPDAGRGFSKRKPRVVYSSSADRGLDVLLSVWPRIREQVPDTELHVFYGWDVFDRVALVNPGLHAYKLKVLGQIASLGGEACGVHMRGRVGQNTLIDEMSQARVWGYPTAFLETSCIGAMEARAAGLPIVTSDLGALHETVGSNGILLPWGPDEDQPANTSPEYKDRFVRHVVTLLTDPKAWRLWHSRERQDVGKLDWSHRVREWEQLLEPVRKTRRGKRAKVPA